MCELRRPTVERLQRLVDEARSHSFTYDAVGATRTIGCRDDDRFTPPAGFDFDQRRTRLGRGDALFAAASEAVGRGLAFPTGWFTVHFPPRSVVVGDVVVVSARVGRLWWSNTARVVYVVDEADERGRRRGFAYGTLPRHVECGEERFLIEQRPDGSVWFDIAAFSRPRHPLVRLCYPWARRLQARFGREAGATLRRCVAQVVGAEPRTNESE